MPYTKSCLDQTSRLFIFWQSHQRTLLSQSRQLTTQLLCKSSFEDHETTTLILALVSLIVIQLAMVHPITQSFQTQVTSTTSFA
eukprot:Awhi_evm1s15280